MAFMVPVMKSEFDIYKGRGSRRTSECSNSSPACRSRKTSECQSLSTSPGNEFITSSSSGTANRHYQTNNMMHTNNNTNNNNGKYRHSQSMPVNRTNSRQFSRTSSRTSQSSLITSPTKNQSNFSPPKPAPVVAGSESSLNKFHLRLVDKLRKSLRKGRSEEDRS